MSLLLLEALGALLIFVLIVWWTMFSGRPGGELPSHHKDADARAEVPPETKEDPDSSHKP